jgi:hypothetical protein
VLIAALLAGGAATATAAQAAPLPEIRVHERNKVPACVTPERLMRFLGSGNDRLLPKFQDIARHYKAHGERLRVRWDYAFFQMILETNYLKFRNASGKGDVDPRQNNFAGIGTTGGGVPGDSFPDVSTGVLGQMQHLIAYSGEVVANPVARRTREKQADIIQRSRALGRPVTFRDLTQRWAADRRYGTSIEAVAERFRAEHCNDRPDEREEIAAARPRAVAETARIERERDPRARIAATPPAAAVARDRDPPQRSGLGVPPQPQPAVQPSRCTVLTASYGGRKNVLIRSIVGAEVRFTAVQVLDGMEASLAESFVRTHARGGEVVGEFPTRDAALVKAFDLCPSGRPQ